MNKIQKYSCCNHHYNMNDLHYSNDEYSSKDGITQEKEHDGAYPKDKRCIDRKLQWIIREISHKARYMTEPKGGQKRVLSIIYQEKEIAQNKLTEMVGIAPGSMSEILNKLVASGYILRLPCETDKRTSIIKITEGGKEHVCNNFGERNECAMDMFSSLNEDEKKTLIDLLTRLDDDWQKTLSTNIGIEKYNHRHERKGRHHSFKRHKYHNNEKEESKL